MNRLNQSADRMATLISTQGGCPTFYVPAELQQQAECFAILLVIIVHSDSMARLKQMGNDVDWFYFGHIEYLLKPVTHCRQSFTGRNKLQASWRVYVH